MLLIKIYLFCDGENPALGRTRRWTGIYSSSLRPEVTQSKRRNGRSQRLLARDGWERAINIRCAGGAHGCPGVSWGMLNNCCGSLRRERGSSEDINRAERYKQTRVYEILDIWGFNRYILSYLGGLKHNINNKREKRGLYCSSKYIWIASYTNSIVVLRSSLVFCAMIPCWIWSHLSKNPAGILALLKKNFV